MRTPSVKRSRYGVFLNRATEFLDSAQEGLSHGHHQVAASNAVHAAIAAVDAVTVFLAVRVPLTVASQDPELCATHTSV